MINAIARKLYRYTREEVVTIVAVMVEVWQVELARPEGYIHLGGLGKFSLDCQQLTTAGAVYQTLADKHGVLRTPTHVARIYGRFRPAESLKQAILSARREHDE